MIGMYFIDLGFKIGGYILKSSVPKKNFIKPISQVIENHYIAFVLILEVSNAMFLSFTLKHVARPVELLNQNNAKSTFENAVTNLKL